MLVHRGAAQEMQRPHSEIERKLYPVMWIAWIIAVVYSIFLPLRLGTIWFYVGFPISMVGLIAYTWVITAFVVTQIDSEPMTKGLYRFSRHPMYISQLVVFMGLGIACASWVVLLYSIVNVIAAFILADSEERYCLEKYGDTYREYMNRTPRWIGVAQATAKLDKERKP